MHQPPDPDIEHESQARPVNLVTLSQHSHDPALALSLSLFVRFTRNLRYLRKMGLLMNLYTRLCLTSYSRSVLAS
jgi:hypothetical protein